MSSGARSTKTPALWKDTPSKAIQYRCRSRGHRAVFREILERERCAPTFRKQGERLRQGFQKLADKYGIIGDIRGKGLLMGIEFVKDLKTKERFPAAPGIGVQIGRKALANGLLCRFDPHWLAFGPALVVTGEQLDDMLAVLDKSMGEVINATANGHVA